MLANFGIYHNLVLQFFLVCNYLNVGIAHFAKHAFEYALVVFGVLVMEVLQ